VCVQLASSASALFRLTTSAKAFPVQHPHTHNPHPHPHLRAHAHNIHLFDHTHIHIHLAPHAHTHTPCKKMICTHMITRSELAYSASDILRLTTSAKALPMTPPLPSPSIMALRESLLACRSLCLRVAMLYICIYIYVCLYVCMHVCMHVHIHE